MNKATFPSSIFLFFFFLFLSFFNNQTTNDKCRTDSFSHCRESINIRHHSQLALFSPHLKPPPPFNKSFFAEYFTSIQSLYTRTVTAGGSNKRQKIIWIKITWTEKLCVESHPPLLPPNLTLFLHVLTE